MRPFYFIHINKCAGTSIRQALRIGFGDHQCDREGCCNIDLKGKEWSQQPAHETAAMARRRLGNEDWEKHYTFSMVRNPFDRVVSQYEYRIRTNRHGLRDRGISFDEFVELLYVARKAPDMQEEKWIAPCYDWLSDIVGTRRQLIVDFIGRFEALEKSWIEICRNVGIVVPLPHRNISKPDLKERPALYYRKFYKSRQTRSVIENHFRRDLETFNYSL